MSNRTLLRWWGFYCFLMWPLPFLGYWLSAIPLTFAALSIPLLAGAAAWLVWLWHWAIFKEQR